MKQVSLSMASLALLHSGCVRLMGYFVNGFRVNRKQNDAMAFPFIRRRRACNIQILVYHRVNDELDPYFPAVPTRVFGRQMAYLSENYHVLGLDEAVERMKRDDVPENAAVVTFDDGYRDNYLNAFPILQRFGVPATVFLATDAIGAERVLWHDRVFAAIRETRAPFLEGLGQSHETYPLASVQDRLAALGHILRLLRSLNPEERSGWIDRIVEQLEVVDRREAKDLMLTWEDVRAMRDGGISFGSHTRSHPILSKLSTRESYEEICGSKRVIEDQLNAPVTTFAYPNGSRADYAESTKRIVRDAGYVCALTALFGANDSDQDLYELRRATPWENDLATFALKLVWYKFQS